MQQQFGHCVGPLGDTIITLVNMFKECGGRSTAYKLAVETLPTDAKPYLDAAVHRHLMTVQQQQQQLQM